MRGRTDWRGECAQRGGCGPAMRVSAAGVQICWVWGLGAGTCVCAGLPAVELYHCRKNPSPRTPFATLNSGDNQKRIVTKLCEHLLCKPLSSRLVLGVEWGQACEHLVCQGTQGVPQKAEGSALVGTPNKNARDDSTIQRLAAEEAEPNSSNHATI